MMDIGSNDCPRVVAVVSLVAGTPPLCGRQCPSDSLLPLVLLLAGQELYLQVHANDKSRIQLVIGPLYMA